MPAAPPTTHRLSPLARLSHLLVVVLGWVGFVWLWWLVAARPWESTYLVWLILGSLILMPLLTGVWVLHNRSIYQRKGERLAVATADAGYAQDWHGRAVQADWQALQHSRHVVVSVDGAHKRYRAGSDEIRAAAPRQDRARGDA